MPQVLPVVAPGNMKALLYSLLVLLPLVPLFFACM
jgi:hypothetical protein